MNRRMPYVICDTTGEPVTPQQAKKIIAETWTVTADVRTRRRSRKTTNAGKAPQQVHTGHDRSDTRGVDNEATFPNPRSSTPSSGPSTRPALTTNLR
jgi:hypothetical protein